MSAEMAITMSPLHLLNGHKFISLTTFRKNGEPVSTPVTFADMDGKLYVITGRTSGKVKRLRHTARVQITPCDSRGKALGDTLIGQARVLSDDEGAMIRRRIKLPVPAPVMFVFNCMRDLRHGGNVYLEVWVG